MLHYVPAGGEGYSERRVQIQVTNQPNETESSDHGKLFKRWRTKNKTVVRVATSSKGGKYSDDNADLIVPILSSSFLKNAGLTKLLANPIHGVFVKSPFEKAGIESIVDSGGFQMLRGTVEFVEPDNLIALYNKDANIGMPLDLPVKAAAEPLFFDAISHMIRANDDYILKGLNKDVDLALISHGSSLERRKARLDVLDRKANVVAIAGLGIKPPPGVDHITSAVENMMYVIHRYHKTARYFHVLGVTSKFWLFIYALIDASKYVKSIGADSVSHRLGALVGAYDTHDFNTVPLEKRLSYRRALPCTCPVCFAIDDIRILSCTVILEAHNLWTRAQWTELLSEMAHQYVAGSINLQAVHKTLRLNMSISDFQKVVKYVETIISTDKYVPLRKQAKSKGLFRDAAPPPMDPKYHKLYTKILTSYGKFHGKAFIKKG